MMYFPTALSPKEIGTLLALLEIHMDQTKEFLYQTDEAKSPDMFKEHKDSLVNYTNLYYKLKNLAPRTIKTMQLIFETGKDLL